MLGFSEPSNEFGPVVYGHECQFGETCCDFECCKSGEVCMEMTGSPSSEQSKNFRAFALALGLPASELASVDFYYDFRLYNLEAVLRNDWRMPGGSGEGIVNKPRTCVPVSDPVTNIRIVILPILNGVFILVMFIAACRIPGLMRKRMLFPFVVLVLSFFLSFASSVRIDLLTAILAVATIFWPRPKWIGFLVLTQFVALVAFVASSTFFDYTWPDIVSHQKQCDAFFGGKFSLGSQRNFMSGYYTGFCSMGWIGFAYLLAQIQFYAVILMFLQDMMEFVLPEPVIWCGRKNGNRPRKSCCCGNSDKYKGSAVVVVSDNGVHRNEEKCSTPLEPGLTAPDLEL